MNRIKILIVVIFVFGFYKNIFGQGFVRQTKAERIEEQVEEYVKVNPAVRSLPNLLFDMSSWSKCSPLIAVRRYCAAGVLSRTLR